VRLLSCRHAVTLSRLPCSACYAYAMRKDLRCYAFMRLYAYSFRLQAIATRRYALLLQRVYCRVTPGQPPIVLCLPDIRQRGVQHIAPNRTFHLTREGEQRRLPPCHLSLFLLPAGSLRRRNSAKRLAAMPRRPEYAARPRAHAYLPRCSARCRAVLFLPARQCAAHSLICVREAF